MRSQRALLVLLCFISLVVCSTVPPLYTKLSNSIQDLQIQKDKPYDPPFSHFEQKGLYESEIHMNFIGDELKAFLRNELKIADMNSFVSNFVVQLQMETGALAEKLGMDLVPSEDSVNAALGVITSDYHDKNTPDIPRTVFWPQLLVNGTWISWPYNVMVPLSETGSLEGAFKKALIDLHLEKFLPEFYALFNETADDLDAFRIPADFDDTSLNLLLGSLVRGQTQHFPQAAAMWNDTNVNISGLMNQWTKFAYRPSSDNTAVNTIDPRSYYFLHEFLEATGGDVSLVTTWISDLDVSRASFAAGVAMPFNVNNVDVSVCANNIVSISSSILASIGAEGNGDITWFTDDLQTIYWNTTQLLVWSLDSGRALSRPDLGLLYYPSIYDFYWFVARSVRLLNGATSLPFGVMEQARDALTAAMRGNGTAQLLSLAQHDGTQVFFDDFLGDNDTSLDGHLLVRGEDRLFSTAVAVNALLSTWATDTDCGLEWVVDTPSEVMSTVAGAVSFLEAEIYGDRYRRDNAFFSGSVKAMDLPFFFPFNYAQFLNGSALVNQTDNELTPDLILAVSGVIPAAQYAAMETQTWFGVPVPNTFPGYNSAPFPFWSAPVLTYAQTLAVLVKAQALETCAGKGQ